DLGFHSLVYLAQALGPRLTGSLELNVFSCGVHPVNDGDALRPLRATVVGPAKLIPLEYTAIACRHFDLALPPSGSKREEALLGLLSGELLTAPDADEVAYREAPSVPQGMERRIRAWQRQPLAAPAPAEAGLLRGGVYLITGGLGGIGLAVAEHLVTTSSGAARLVLVG
ncbi:MAG: KR domain-containing protein, partial [FCB group bacterium]|nr:KR domain-containing protein [FCB group bacterium]